MTTFIVNSGLPNTKYNVRLAVNSGEKNFFHRKAPASFSDECAESGEFF